MNSNPDPCIDAETLAAFTEGKLARRDIPPVLAHLETCPSCFDAVQRANASLAQEPKRFQFHWLAAAAVIALVVAAIPFVRSLARRDGMSRLVALAPRDARPVEARLTGGFAWAPYHGPMRARESSNDANRLKLDGAAGDAVERADREHSADAERAAGVALVLVEQPLEAAARLRDATTRAPNDAKAWSDLAAAQYAAGLRLARPSLYPEALAAADHALRIDPLLPEALFNRALLLERLGLRQQAYEAWQRYLRVDGGSPWAAEARSRAAAMAPETGEQRFKQQLPLLERAVFSSDSASLTRIVDRYREQSRAFAEAEYLGQWSDAVRRGDVAEASRTLAVSRAIGDALVKLSGESLVREAVRAIDDGDASRRAAIAEAHEAYRRGRIAYSRHEPLAAEPDLRRAAALFESAHDPMSVMSRYYAAQARFDRSDVAGASIELESLRATLSGEPQFAAAGALVEWELALCMMVDDDWMGALDRVSAAQATFRRIGERSNLGFIETLLGDDLACLDRAEESWAARIRSFELLSSEGRGDRLPVALGGAARMELRAGRLDSARAMLQVEVAADRAAGVDVLLTNALVRQAALIAALGDDDGSLRVAREATAVANSIADASLRDRALIDAGFAEGAASLRSDPKRARAALTRAIDGYRSHDLPFFLAEPQLLRARANAASGLRAEAARDLDAGIEVLESHRLQFAAGVVGTGAFDAGVALFHDAIAMSLDRGDVARAFAYAERSRRQLKSMAPIGAAELQQRLRGSGAAVLELVVLPSEIVAFTITADDLSVSRRPFEGGLEQASDSNLYDVLIRPSERAVAHARELIIVPDPRLAGVAFAALIDAARQQHLIEKLPIAMASSASSLLRDDGVARRESIAVVGLPTGGSDHTIALPESDEELADVSSLYRAARTLSGDGAAFAAVWAVASQADVVHISGHTARQNGGGDTALMFATERVSWRDVATAAPLSRRPVVLLAACETLRRFPERSSSMSLGDGFIAAGAGDVIGTLAPVSDTDAREIFRAIHRELASGASAAEALRRAQLQAISAEASQHRRTEWRSVALLTNRIPRIQEGS